MEIFPILGGFGLRLSSPCLEPDLDLGNIVNISVALWQPSKTAGSLYGVFAYSGHLNERKTVYPDYQRLYMTVIYLDEDFLIFYLCLSLQAEMAPNLKKEQLDLNKNLLIFSRNKSPTRDQIGDLAAQLKKRKIFVRSLFGADCQIKKSNLSEMVTGKRFMWEYIREEDKKYYILELCLQKATSRPAILLCFVEFDSFS